MRAVAIGMLLIVAGCSDTGGAEKEKAKAAAAPEAGQWEVASEVTAFRAMDNGEPKINTPQGTRTAEAICVGAGEGGRPDPALFAGADYECQYGDYYMRNGRMNLTMQCTRESMPGTIGITVEGTFQGSEFAVNRTIDTSLTSDGDVQITSRLTGRRSGACQPGAAEGNAQGNAAGNAS